MIIFTIEWTLFHQEFFNAKTIFVKEDDKGWIFYTMNDNALVKCVVEKKEDMQENITFVERYMKGMQNMVKVLSVQGDEKRIKKEEISETESPEATREEEPKVETLEKIDDTQFIKEHLRDAE